MSTAIISRVAARLEPARGSFRAGRFVAHLTCVNCRTEDEWTAGNMPRPDVVLAKFARRGWTIGRRPTCPICTRIKENDMTISKTLTKPATPSPAALALNREIRSALDLAYDDDKQRYNAGYTDEKVAQMVGNGCPPAAVAALREKAYGPAGEPDEVSELRQAIDAAQSEVGKLRSRFDLMCSKNGFKQS